MILYHICYYIIYHYYHYYYYYYHYIQPYGLPPTRGNVVARPLSLRCVYEKGEPRYRRLQNKRPTLKICCEGIVFILSREDFMSDVMLMWNKWSLTE